MDIYITSKLNKHFSTPSNLKKKYGDRADKILMIVSVLDSAPDLSHILSLRSLGLHRLTGNKKNHFGITINRNYRLIIKPYKSDIPYDSHGNIEYSDITSIEILDIEDYH